MKNKAPDPKNHTKETSSSQQMAPASALGALGPSPALPEAPAAPAPAPASPAEPLACQLRLLRLNPIPSSRHSRRGFKRFGGPVSFFLVRKTQQATCSFFKHQTTRKTSLWIGKQPKRWCFKKPPEKANVGLAEITQKASYKSFPSRKMA